MKRLSVVALSGFLFLAANGSVWAESDKVKVYQCPMDSYTALRHCAVCGMKMEEKEMTSADAQAAIEKSKEMMRKRS